MRFVDVRKFNLLDDGTRQVLRACDVLPVTPVTLWNWDAINEKTETGERKYRYILNKGSSRSGKTIGLIDCIDRYAREYKNKRCTVWRDTKTDCKKTVLNDIQKHLKATARWKKNFEFNKTESILSYINGSSYEIHGTDDENTVHGLTQDVAHLNEPYGISKEVFDQIDQRTADFILIDLNPKQGHWSDDLAKDPRTLVIHSTFNDNPLCPIESKAKILSYQPVSLSDIVIRRLLETDQALNYDCLNNPLKFLPLQIEELQRCQENEFKRSADTFNWNVYGLGLKAEKPNRIFKWTEIPDSEYFALKVTEYTGVDWGVVDPWGIIEAKYYDGGLYLHELNYKSENEIRANLTSTEQAQINSADEGIVKWLFRKFNIPFDRTIICDNNRPLKIFALRDAGWEYAFSPETIKYKGSILDGIDLLNNLRVYFTSSSENIKYEQENYSRKVDRTGVILDEPEDTNNHTLDPARYIALYLQAMGVINTV